MSASPGEVSQLEREAAELEELWREAAAHLRALSERPAVRERSAGASQDVVKLAAERAEAATYCRYVNAQVRLSEALAELGG